MHFLIIAATTLISSGLVVRGSPLPPSTLEQRAAVKFHVLTDAEGAAEGCSKDQIAQIKEGIADAKKLADVAISVLQVPKMEQSNGFFLLFGGSQNAKPNEIIKRFQFVKKLATPDEVASTDAFENSKTDVTFTCVPATDPKASEANANVANIGRATGGGAAPTVNLIRLTPTGLGNTATFTEAAAKLTASGKIQDAFLLGKAPNGKRVAMPFMAFTLVHEIQHVDAMMDNPTIDHFVDEKTGLGETATGLQQVQLQLSDSKKKRNPQNYSFFALYAKSNPEFFSPECFIGTTPPLGAKARRSLGLRIRELFERVTKAKAKAAVKAKPAAKPVAAKPVAKKPVAAKPVAKKPVAAKPVAKPVAKAPVVKKPVAAKPAAKPVAKKPAAKPVAKPVTKAPAAAKPVAKPVAAKPIAKAPVAKKPTAVKPVAKPVTKAPVAKKPVAAKPVAAKPGTKVPPAKPPVSGKKVVPSKAKAVSSAKPSASAAATCKSKTCASCAKIKKGIPGDVQNLLGFD
ncbi:hypothetical protein DFH08DRAFT_840924 [Mycena albidolilacea]|uniref:Lysine-specific metallo-endopeptidase domain-containing protein n=1 Tax=Mycena albidolilacea TaxID=1033008 RepID=A0AAD7ALV5_9AGAR|nr:hypothetical protein DFH08DRAFT_840924 [Mycena albidolilacea]